MVISFFVKRVFDIFASIVALIVLFPFLLIIGVILFFTIKDRSVFFKQQRLGLNEEPFKIIKFKTMTDKRDEQGNLLHDKYRLTKTGRFIRGTSLDELPQLINVLKGDMSLVGPRPLLPKYLPLYNERQARRHEVKPGITGWTQVNGRNSISWKEKFEHDVWYVDNLTFFTDMKIFWLTVKKVFRRDGINQVGVENAVAFKGNS